MQVFRSGLLSALQQFQKVTFVPKALCALFPVFYLLGFIPEVERNIILTPGHLAPPLAKLWTLITSIFYEKSLILVVFDMTALMGFSLILEPLWGLRRFLVTYLVAMATHLKVFVDIFSACWCY
jgi:membrane associated rhomboid family serine protease